MADMLTLPVDKIRAVLQECRGISVLEREGIMDRLEAHDVTPARPELTSTYVLVNVLSSFTFPEPPGFELLKSFGDTHLPYELLHQVSIPHLVVVTADPVYAVEFFEMLKSQESLEIGALEFLILPHCVDIRGSYVYDPKIELEGSTLMNWARGSNSVKIVTEETTVEKELERHVRFVLKHNRLHNLRGLTDADRAELDDHDETVMTAATDFVR